MIASASKINDVRSSVQKDRASFKNRRSVSADTRSRGSYVPDKKRPSSEERKSGGKLNINRKFLPCTPNARGNSGWGGARKSSINLSESKRKDGRPLTDKAYQKRKVCELVEFLEEIGFNPPISTTKLMAPSKKDFENIFQCLYSYFDPKYEVKKIEEEAPKILKNLGYPFTVNKSAFVYVARTNWPSLLGVLIWLMDLYKFAMKVDMQNVSEIAGDDEKAQMHKILLQYICRCYHSNIDNEEEENVVFTRIIKSYMTENMDELVAKNEEKKQRLASVEKEINGWKKLNEDNIEYKKSIEKCEDFILKMESHSQKKNEICEQLTKELKQKESEYTALQEEVSRKQDAYDAQGFDGKKHLSYFETQKKELVDKLDKKRAFVKELKDKLWETEIEYNKRSAEVIEATKSAGKLYNDTVDSLKNILDPLLSINNVQVKKLCSNFQLEFPFWEEIQFDKRNSESNKAFNNALENIILKLKQTDEILKQIHALMNQNLNEIEMKKSDVSMKLKLLTIQENKQEQDLNSKKKLADDEISTLEALYTEKTQAIEKFKVERSKIEKIHREMIAERDYLIEFRKKKEKELNEYLKEQVEIFEYYKKSEQEVLEISEACGNKIAGKLEELQRV